VFQFQKDTTINPEELQLSRFKKLLLLCCPRPEMDSVFSEMLVASCMQLSELVLCIASVFGLLSR